MTEIIDLHGATMRQSHFNLFHFKERKVNLADSQKEMESQSDALTCMFIAELHLVNLVEFRHSTLQRDESTCKSGEIVQCYRLLPNHPIGNTSTSERARKM